MQGAKRCPGTYRAVYLLEPAQQKDSLEVIKEDEATNAASKDEIPDAVFKDEPDCFFIS
jgi:hypothetical protein